MTPRALLTIIGATAIAFAVAIGTAAGFAGDGVTTTVTASSHATSGTHLARALAMHSAQTASASGDCVVAL